MECNLFELSNAEALDIMNRAKVVNWREAQEVSQFLEIVNDIIFSIYRVFYPSHKDFVELYKGKVYNDESVNYVYVTIYRSPLDQSLEEEINEALKEKLLKSPLVTEIVEVTDKEREVFGGYMFRRSKGESLLRYTVTYQIGGDRKEVSNLDELKDLYQACSQLRKDLFRNYDPTNFFALNHGYRRMGYL